MELKITPTTRRNSMKRYRSQGEAYFYHQRTHRKNNTSWKQLTIYLAGVRDPDTVLAQSKAYREFTKAGSDDKPRTNAILVAAMESLPEPYRITAYLRFVRECSYQEIAEVCSCPIGTVKSRIAKTIAYLQAILCNA
jgi:RNA polymerase sigma-70 factor (ECF subfamily)